MELKYKNWDDISIARYRDIINLAGGDGEEANINYNIDTLAYLCGVTRDEVECLPVEEFTRLMHEARWLKVIKEEVVDENIIINGKPYDLIHDMSEFIVSQYIDWQTLSANSLDNLARLLACILIPKGKSYGVGYDMEGVVSDIEQHLPVLKGYGIMRFFEAAQRDLFADTLRYGVTRARKMELRTLDKVKKGRLRALRQQLQRLQHSLG